MLRRVLLCSVAVIALGVPAANALTIIDLTTAGTTYTATDGSVWTNTLLFHSTGTGTFEPFLRVQDENTYTGTPLGVEEGMNTDGDRVYEQVGGGDPHTHAVQFGDLKVETINGTDYYVFTIDFAEPAGNGQEFLTIEEFRLHTVDETAGGSLTTEGAVIAAAGHEEHYDLDETEDQAVLLDYKISNKGNGESDIDFYIPVDEFSGASDSDYFYAYIKFGRVDEFASSSFQAEGSFEELRVLTEGGSGNAPEPGTVALFGIGILGLAVYRRK